MRGWFFSGHPIINVTNGLSPLFRHPNWVRRHWGFRYPTLGLAHVHLEPVSSSTVACSSSTRGTVGRTSRGRGGLAPTCGGWVLQSFRFGRRWPAIRLGSGWVPVCSRWGLADFCPAACQRLPWMESRFEVASAEVIYD